MYQGIDSLFMNKLQIVVFLKKEKKMQLIRSQVSTFKGPED